MSSDTPWSPAGVVGKLIAGMGDKIDSSQAVARMSNLGMNPRQRRLNWLWSWYRCTNYDGRPTAWDGSETPADPVAREAIASQRTIPPGFKDAGRSLVPLVFRRPSAPYRLARVVVDRFTGLLFGKRSSPLTETPGSDLLNDYVKALIRISRFWTRMATVRGYGGATGTAVAGFVFLNGKPVIEVHDPRWCFPTFESQASQKLVNLEIRYMFPKDIPTKKGLWKTEWFWYRRIIDEESDTLFKVASVGKGDEPRWEVGQRVDHDFGFCPAVWGQNLPVEDDVDGFPDCDGAYEMMEEMDKLLSQAARATIANCDPTLVIATDKEGASEVRKGSDNAIVVGAQDKVSYLEINGAGIERAESLADSHRDKILEMTQSVIDAPKMTQQTATEVNKRFDAMHAKADILRSQYGDQIVVPLVEMMVAASKLLVRRLMLDEETNDIVREIPLFLVDTTVDNFPIGAGQADKKGNISASADKVLGLLALLKAPIDIRLKWPDYTDPSLDDVTKAVAAAAGAVAGNVADRDSATKFVAPYLKIDDPDKVVKAVNEAVEKQEAMPLSSLLASGAGPAPPGLEGPPKPKLVE